MNGRWKAWLFVALIFAAGVLTGVAVMLGHTSAWMRPPSPRQMQHHWIAHLTDRLDLTPDQQAKIEPILATAEQKIHGVHRDELNRMSAIFQETNGQITPLLTPEQQQKFAQMQQEGPSDFPYHHHFGHGPDDHGPPPDGPPTADGTVSAAGVPPDR